MLKIYREYWKVLNQIIICLTSYPVKQIQFKLFQLRFTALDFVLKISSIKTKSIIFLQNSITFRLWQCKYYFKTSNLNEMAKKNQNINQLIFFKRIWFCLNIELLPAECWKHGLSRTTIICRLLSHALKSS